MRLAWCDKVALVWGGTLFLILACAWRGGWIFWYDGMPPIWLGAWQFGWWLVGIPWLFLRFIDLALGGPARRRGVISARVLDPGLHGR